MLKTVQGIFKRWLKRQFHGNPLVEDTGPYLQRVSQAFSIGFLGAAACIALMIVGSILFVVGALYGWF